MPKAAVVVALGVLAWLPLAGSPVQAQLLDQLKGAVGSGQSGGGLSGALPSLGSASPSNIGGLLQYCVQNNFLGGGSAASVKDSLTSKLTGSGRGPTDPQYQAGSRGVVESGGQNFSLGGGGIKEQVTRQVCDQVLQHAKSLI